MRTDGNVAKKRGEGVSDRAYLEWIADLKHRYRRTQIKAAVAVNSAMLEFYWSLGKDISGKYPGKKRNLGFFDNLSNDLCLGIKNSVELSARNLRYSLAFYQLYSYRQQVVADNGNDALLPQIVEDNGGERYLQQVVADNVVSDLMKVPWGHHILIIGKSKGDRDKALFYVRKTIENGWSRTDLQVAIGDRLYEKTGKALANFSGTLPAPDGYLAKELIKNEYSFALTETVDENNEREVEKALVDIGERSGMGLADLYGHWKKHGLIEPVISEEYDPDRVKITVYTDSGQDPTKTRPIGPRVPQECPKFGPRSTQA